MKYVLTILLLVIALSTVMVGGLFSYPNLALRRSYIPQNAGARLIPDDPSEGKKSLQLKALNFAVPSCTPGQKVVVDLLVDVSCSMGSETESISKLGKLKTAVNEFALNHLQDDDVVGVQKFDKLPENVFDLNTWQINKPTFESTIQGLRRTGCGTYMKDGLQFAKEKIDPVRPNYPNHNWALILVSDGKPNAGQDPRTLAQEVKKDIRIITIGIDIANNQKAITVLKETASDPSDFYNSSSDDLSKIYQGVAQSLCR